jgi:hypothetical protein
MERHSVNTMPPPSAKVFLIDSIAKLLKYPWSGIFTGGD